MKIKTIFVIISLTVLCSCAVSQEPGETTGIRIHPQNPYYWELNSQPMMLLGGSAEDNLFQINNLTEHLDLLASVGGNYVRNTMSSRDKGDEWPFRQQRDDLYDLTKWNKVYWEKFEAFLKETAKRGVIVQIEVWATFDFYRDFWELNPFNPKNNVNYDSRESQLPETVMSHPVNTDNNFFRSVPSQMNLSGVLRFQQQFVNKLLSYSLRFDHILYCMDNETSVNPEWGKYWANYIQKKTRFAGKQVYTTEMWDPHDLNHPLHAEFFDNPDIFQFVEISQNNHQSSDKHWNNGIRHIKRLEKIQAIRPVNNVKIYGNDGGAHKTTRDAIENFVKNILMGCASARFHRPSSGQGLNETAQVVIRSMRNLTDKMYFFEGHPDNGILQSREPGEAYCRAVSGKEYAIYFPDGGEVELDLSGFKEEPSLVWLNVLTSKWSDEESLGKGNISLVAPNQGHWIALIQ